MLCEAREHVPFRRSSKSYRGVRECSAVAVLVEVSRDVNEYTQRSFKENIVSELRRNSI